MSTTPIGCSIVATQCWWCKDWISRGTPFLQSTQPRWITPILRLVTKIGSDRDIPHDINRYIQTFLVDTESPTFTIDKWIFCMDCSQHEVYITKSGRCSYKTNNNILPTISGSGFAGCDHYDNSFDGNDKLSRAEQQSLVWSQQAPDLKGFIVSDKELTSQHAIMDTVCDDESEFSNYETSEDESDEPCWLYSDEED
ncbi:MAG: hypothetical protein V3W20_12255 [Candidatus Neomarinimicrobiota bacterium]